MNEIKNISYNVKNLNHCPLDYILEEVYKLGKINILTIGTGECAYFTSKQNFSDKQLNYSYILEDKEIVFGDFSSLEDAFSLLNNSEYKTIVVITCIPAIMNLNLDYLIDQYPKLLLFSAPCFKEKNIQKILSDFYYVFFSKINLTIKEKTEKLNYDEYSYDLFINKISSSTLIIENPVYLKLAKFLSEKYKIKIIYNTKINNLNFYKENHSLLDISQKDIEEIEAKLKKINKKETYNVLTNYPSLKEFVNQYEININLVDEKTNDTIVVNEAKPFDALIKFIRSAYAFK